MSLDQKGKEIAYQVAFKAAIDLIAAGKAIIDPAKPVGDEVKELTDSLFVSLLAGLEPARPLASVSAVGHEPGEPPLLTDTACPTCAAAGRSGVLIHNTDPSYKGPEFKCSLKQIRKVGTKFVDTGVCDFQDWGRNSRY